ncbi:Uncharacterized protein GBIM_18933 [Gryllus bimaculatus]|nr:Uncharacterized protein GBIM_18933 [Gryllus bimaculatus]
MSGQPESCETEAGGDYMRVAEILGCSQVEEAGGMQRCPYIHEMKERLLSQTSHPDQMSLDGMDKDVLEVHGDPAVGTIVKLNPDGYGSHTSPAHHCSRQHLADDLSPRPPKNAKSSRVGLPGRLGPREPDPTSLTRKSRALAAALFSYVAPPPPVRLALRGGAEPREGLPLAATSRREPREGRGRGGSVTREPGRGSAVAAAAAAAAATRRRWSVAASRRFCRLKIIYAFGPTGIGQSGEVYAGRRALLEMGRAGDGACWSGGAKEVGGGSRCDGARRDGAAEIRRGRSVQGAEAWRVDVGRGKVVLGGLGKGDRRQVVLSDVIELPSADPSPRGGTEGESWLATNPNPSTGPQLRLRAPVSRAASAAGAGDGRRRSRKRRLRHPPQRALSPPQQPQLAPPQ